MGLRTVREESCFFLLFFCYGSSNSLVLRIAAIIALLWRSVLKVRHKCSQNTVIMRVFAPPRTDCVIPGISVRKVPVSIKGHVLGQPWTSSVYEGHPYSRKGADLLGVETWSYSRKAGRGRLLALFQYFSTFRTPSTESMAVLAA